jgi:hypothetical protein
LTAPLPVQAASPNVSSNPAARIRSTVRWLAVTRLIAQARPAKNTASIGKALGPGRCGGKGGRDRGTAVDGAAVVTKISMELPGTAGFGSTMQVASKGAPVHVRVTFKPKPPSGLTCSEYFASCPGETVAEDNDPDGAARVKSWPVPLRTTLCAPPSVALHKYVDLLMSVTYSARLCHVEPPKLS